MAESVECPRETPPALTRAPVAVIWAWLSHHMCSNLPDDGQQVRPVHSKVGTVTVHYELQHASCARGLLWGENAKVPLRKNHKKFCLYNVSCGCSLTSVRYSRNISNSFIIREVGRNWNALPCYQKASFLVSIDALSLCLSASQIPSLPSLIPETTPCQRLPAPRLFLLHRTVHSQRQFCTFYFGWFSEVEVP